MFDWEKESLKNQEKKIKELEEKNSKLKKTNKNLDIVIKKIKKEK